MDIGPLVTASDRLAAASTRVRVGTASMRDRVTDGELLHVLRCAAEARNAADLIVAAATAEIAERSARDRGRDGLARQQGHRNATALVQAVTGQSRSDVFRALRTGIDLAEGSAADSDAVAGDSAGGDSGGGESGAGRSGSGEPGGVEAAERRAASAHRWLRSLRASLVAGTISQAQYQAIRVGLGEPPVEQYPKFEPEFLPEAWAQAVRTLLVEAGDLPVEELRAAARIARDRLDPVGVTRRFDERFAARSFGMWTDEHGQQHARIAFDDEAAAWVQAILSAALRPRRGPRFVEAGAASSEGRAAGDRAAAALAIDERSNEQLQYDTLVAVLRTGAAADPAQSFGDRQPGVRIIVEQPANTAADADAGAGAGAESGSCRVGHLEDGGSALPSGVVEAHLCDTGAVQVTVDARGRPLDVGREKRLFTRAQRVAIAARDGGCVGVHCTAPISWCEYHHVDHWAEHRGRTDVDDGVPLCRTCHLRLHNQGHRIVRTRDPHTGRDSYWWHAPPDPATGLTPEPVRLRSRSPRRFAAA